MRHFESGAARRAAATAGIPIINAGDGPGQHPTQVCIEFSSMHLCFLMIEIFFGAKCQFHLGSPLPRIFEKRNKV